MIARAQLKVYILLKPSPYNTDEDSNETLLTDLKQSQYFVQIGTTLYVEVVKMLTGGMQKRTYFFVASCELFTDRAIHLLRSFSNRITRSRDPSSVANRSARSRHSVVSRSTWSARALKPVKT